MNTLASLESTPDPRCRAARPASLCVRTRMPVRITPEHGHGAVRVEVSCLWYGASNGPTIIVQGGISAGRDACASPAHDGAGWWPALVGPGLAIDTRRVNILAIDWLDAGQLGAEVVTTADQANALAALLDELGIAQVAALVGCSYGAMVGLAFAARHAARCGRLVAIAGGHRPHPLASAQRAVQRGILELGRRHGCEHAAVTLARQLALTTYRGEREFAQRFAGPASRQSGAWQRPVEAWLEHNAGKFAARFDARRYSELSQSIDLHEVDPASITRPVQLIGIASDRLVPLADLCELQRQLAGHASLEVIDSVCGHDGFLTESAQLAGLLAPLVDQLCPPEPRAEARDSATLASPTLAWSA